MVNSCLRMQDEQCIARYPIRGIIPFAVDAAIHGSTCALPIHMRQRARIRRLCDGYLCPAAVEQRHFCKLYAVVRHPAHVRKIEEVHMARRRRAVRRRRCWRNGWWADGRELFPKALAPRFGGVEVGNSAEDRCTTSRIANSKYPGHRVACAPM